MRNVTLMAALILVLPAAGHAQSIYFGGGALIPISDFGDVADTGFMGIGGITFDLGDTGLAIGAEGMYGPGNGAGTNPDIDVFSAMGLLELDFEGGGVTPYVFGGAGIIGANPDGADSDTEFGYQGGAGLGFALGGNVSLFAEGRYMGSDSLDLIGALAGLAIGFGG